MMCNYRFGDALLFLSLLFTFAGYLFYEAFLMKSWVHFSLASFLCASFVVATVANRKDRQLDELKAHRDMQQRMLGNPGDMV